MNHFLDWVSLLITTSSVVIGLRAYHKIHKLYRPPKNGLRASAGWMWRAILLGIAGMIFYSAVLASSFFVPDVKESAIEILAALAAQLYVWLPAAMLVCISLAALAMGTREDRRA